MIGYNDNSATGLTATGSTLATGLALNAKFNNVTTAAASTGVVLPLAAAGDVVFVRNGGANALSVYPNSATGTIGGGSAGAAVSLAVTNDKTKNAMFVCWGSDVWAQVVSA